MKQQQIIHTLTGHMSAVLQIKQMFYSAT